MSKKVGSSSKTATISQEVRQKQQLRTMKKMDVSHLKQDIHSLRQQLKHLQFLVQLNRINQKVNIQKQMQRRTQEYMSQSYDLEKVAKKQQEQLIELENKLKILRNTFSEAEIKKKKQLGDEIFEINRKKQGEREELRKVQQALGRKVEHLKKFKERQITYLSTISQLQQRKQNLFQSHSRDIEKIKNSYETKRQQIKQITNKQIQTIQTQQVSKIRQKLSKEQQIKRENQLMQQEIKLCEQQKAIVENECRMLGDEIKRSAEDQSRLGLGEQATETYERSLRVIKLEGKINKLKQFLNDEVKRLQEETKQLDKNYDEQQRQTQEKIEKLKTALSLKQRDYKKVKACSQMVLNQRSPLQSYLLQVFYQNPQLNNKQPSTVNQTLRKLFIKINSRKAPISYKNYMNVDLGQSGASNFEENIQQDQSQT